MGAVSVDQRAPIGPLPVGAKLGRYEILGKLAAGGMAIVYVARAHGVAGFERLVAIKVLHSNLAHEEEFIKMFLDEARLAASIRHPNVVPTIDISDSETSGYFIVMEYIEGDHLGQLLSSANKLSERLPIRVTLRVIGDALGGLAAAHDLRDEQGNKQNLVHRDVSPHNIMVGRDGVARLTDFGVAKAEDRLTHTRDGQVKGKLAYMAPEQAASGTTDTRSDLFSMGVILWECLTGQRLLRAESTAATLHKLLHGEIPKPSSVFPELAPLDDVLAKALARDPDRRYPTAEEFARALEDVSSVFGGAASLREVSRVVTHHAAARIKRDKKLIEDALKALRPAGAADGHAGVFTDEQSSPTSPTGPSSTEISIVAGSPSLISKLSSVSNGLANDTMPGTRRADGARASRATRRSAEIPLGASDRKPAAPSPLAASDSHEVLVAADSPQIDAAVASGDEPVTRNRLGPRDEGGGPAELAGAHAGHTAPPVMLSSMFVEPSLQVEIDALAAPDRMSGAPQTFSNAPHPNRKVYIAVFAFGVAALAFVAVLASSSTQEVVKVEEMGGALSLDGAKHAAPVTTSSVGSSVKPPEPATTPANSKDTAAQALVPTVPAAAPTSQSQAALASGTSGRAKPAPATTGSSAVRAESAKSVTTRPPAVRRHRERELTKPVAPHLDVIPNPYHD